MSAAKSASSATRPALLAFSLGHGSADLCSGALWSLLPFLVVERHYSYGAVGVFALVASLGSALLQPLFGPPGASRTREPGCCPWDFLVGGLGIAAVGFAGSFPLTLASVAVCSAGVAAYHPEGARWARLAAGSRVTSDMSVFSLGGGIGWALGPLVVAAVVIPSGLRAALGPPRAVRGRRRRDSRRAAPGAAPAGS